MKKTKTHNPILFKLTLFKFIFFIFFSFLKTLKPLPHPHCSLMTFFLFHKKNKKKIEIPLPPTSFIYLPASVLYSTLPISMFFLLFKRQKSQPSFQLATSLFFLAPLHIAKDLKRVVNLVSNSAPPILYNICSSQAALPLCRKMFLPMTTSAAKLNNPLFILILTYQHILTLRALPF